MADSNKKPIIIKAGPKTSFLLDGLQNDTMYKVQVKSFGDKRFFDSAPVMTTVTTDDNGKELVGEFRKYESISFRKTATGGKLQFVAFGEKS